MVGNTITWDLGSLAPGASGSKSYQVTVSAGATNGQTVVNAAEINSSQTDANFADNQSTVTTTVRVPAISGTVLDDLDGDGNDNDGGLGLASATVKLFIDSTSGGTVGSLDVGDLPVGSTITTDATGAWTFSGAGVVVSRTYFVTRTNPSGYTSTQAIPGSGTSSTATKITNDQIKVVLGALPTFSANNKFLAQAPQNQAPVAAAQSVTTDEDTAKTITLSATDADNNTLTFAIVGSPSHGALGSIGTVTCWGSNPKT